MILAVVSFNFIAKYQIYVILQLWRSMQQMTQNALKALQSTIKCLSAQPLQSKDILLDTKSVHFVATVHHFERKQHRFFFTHM